MNRKSFKFIIIGLIVVGAIVYLAFSGYQESKAYFMHVDEVRSKGQEVVGLRLNLHGFVKKDSIKREGKNLEFILEYNKRSIPVIYNGKASIPDTFKGGTEAVVTGKMSNENLFVSNKIQAKCSSKYEPDYKKLKK